MGGLKAHIVNLEETITKLKENGGDASRESDGRSEEDKKTIEKLEAKIKNLEVKKSEPNSVVATEGVEIESMAEELRILKAYKIERDRS